MTRTPSPPPLEHRVELPEGTTEVLGVFVDGVELRRGEDYDVHADHVRLRRGVRPARPLRRRDLLAIGLCVERAPEGETVDLVVRRRA